MRSDTLFGKRENNGQGLPNSPIATNPATTQKASAASTTSPTQFAASASSQPITVASVPAASDASRLSVGRNTKIKGEIVDCDLLVVEGTVEATLASRVIQIAKDGFVKGSAKVFDAEVHGKFDGDLVAQNKVVIYATGCITGEIRCAELVVEEGGKVKGTVQVGAECVAEKNEAKKLI